MEEYMMTIAANPPYELYQSMAKCAVDIDRFLTQLGMTEPMIRAQYGTCILRVLADNGISKQQKKFESAGRGSSPLPGM